MSNKRLYKSSVNYMLCGVCGGIAEYFDIDPTLVRLAWIIFTCFGGAGIGCIVLAVALAGLVFLIWTATRVLPMLLRKFVDFCSRLVNRNMKKEAGL